MPPVKPASILSPPSTRHASPSKSQHGAAEFDRPSGHAIATRDTWLCLQDLIDGKDAVVLDGESLDLGAIIAVAQYGVTASVTSDAKVLARLSDSVNFLSNHILGGRHVYGVNTGFGGSADTRTDHLEALQRGLIQHQHTGVLLPTDKGGAGDAVIDDLKSHALPNQVVKASMLIRCNSLIRGHSAVRVEAVKSILTLLSKDLTPVTPLRGSISASGDLSPLSYIAGVLEGNPDIYVNCGAKNNYRIIPADEALRLAGLEPIVFGAKEGLGLLNGTATSCAAASITLFQAQQIALLSQVLTAMGTEALLGSTHNYHPFIVEARPHEGQREVASNVLGFLADSKLAADTDPKNIGLAQDRYALRTSSQWIGPQLEDLMLAQRQIERELNSTTDNPLIDVVGEAVHHGGNFQAVSVTSAMEKTMTALQMIGKLLFAQCSEVINPMLNQGLPPNLCADDPSLSFTFKGVDINMAAYMSELAYLAHPVSSHVQSAEMHNQALNSLALIAARYTSDAIDVVSLMSATYLYVVCQALDLRALHLEFVKAAERSVKGTTARIFESALGPADLDALHDAVWPEIVTQWADNSKHDLETRGPATTAGTVSAVIDFVGGIPAERPPPPFDILSALQTWRVDVGATLNAEFAAVRRDFFAQPTTHQYLCQASRLMYTFVRQTLRVPMHRGLLDHPTQESGEDIKAKKTIGSHVTTVYTALRTGELGRVLMDCLA